MDQDVRQFGAIQSQLTSLNNGQAALLAALNVSHDPVRARSEASSKPLGTASQGELLWKIIGSLGGVMVALQVAVASWPFFLEWLHAIVKIH